MLNGIFYMLRTGSPWRDLLERYGPHTTVYNRFNRWARAGVWVRVFETLSARSPSSMALIDSSIMRAHQHAAGGKRGGGPDHAIGRSRGGLSTKINAVVDENGLPVRLVLSAGQAHNLKAVPELLAGLKCRHVVADRGYDADALLDLIRIRGAKAHIPSTSQRIVHRSVNRRIYRQRNLVERFFCKLKHFRRVATRFDKLASNFLAAVALAAARLWLRAYESTT